MTFRSAVVQYIRIREEKGVPHSQIRQEIEYYLNGVRDSRLPDDAIILIDAE